MDENDKLLINIYRTIVFSDFPHSPSQLLYIHIQDAAETFEGPYHPSVNSMPYIPSPPYPL